MAFQPNFTLADPFGSALSGFQIGADMAAQQQQLELQRQQAAQQQQQFDFTKSLWGNVRQQSDLDLALANLNKIRTGLEVGEFSATSPFRIQDAQTTAGRNSLGLAVEEISALPKANADAAVANTTAQYAPQMGALNLQQQQAQIAQLYQQAQSRALMDQLAMDESRRAFANMAWTPVSRNPDGTINYMSGLNGQVVTSTAEDYQAAVSSLMPQVNYGQQAPGQPQQPADPFGMPQFPASGAAAAPAPGQAPAPQSMANPYPQVDTLGAALNAQNPMQPQTAPQMQQPQMQVLPQPVVPAPQVPTMAPPNPMTSGQVLPQGVQSMRARPLSVSPQTIAAMEAANRPRINPMDVGQSPPGTIQPSPFIPRPGGMARPLAGMAAPAPAQYQPTFAEQLDPAALRELRLRQIRGY